MPKYGPIDLTSVEKYEAKEDHLCDWYHETPYTIKKGSLYIRLTYKDDRDGKFHMDRVCVDHWTE